jgi:hypothetical protein
VPQLSGAFWTSRGRDATGLDQGLHDPTLQRQSDSTEDPERGQFDITLNWFEELKRLVPN